MLSVNKITTGNFEYRKKMIILNLFYFNKLSNIQYFKELGHAFVENGSFLA